MLSSGGTAQSGCNSNGTTYSEQVSRETNCIRISTQGTLEENNEGNTFTIYPTTGSANKYIRDALHKSDTTKEVHVAGVGTMKTRYVIRFKDGPSTETARTEPSQMRKTRCDRCLTFGHLAWTCKEKARCGYCAGENDRRKCFPRVAARCVDCGSAHATGDRDCETRRRSGIRQ